MEMIIMPFEIERAKRIQAGEEPGKIAMRNGDDVRIICWDMKNLLYPIVALVKGVDEEYVENYTPKGEFLKNESHAEDLVLQIPEWTQFKDGDILVSIYGDCFILKVNGEHKTSCYASMFFGKISFDNTVNAGHIETITYANEEEKQRFIDALKASTDPRAKEYLKRFFGIGEKKEYKFEPFQRVLVRDNGYEWEAALFSYLKREVDHPYNTVGGDTYQCCIPYNDQTKHLLGTADDWKE